MTWQDIANGLFELLAGVSVLNHCRVLYKDKLVRGASVLSTGFFFLWGIWNLYYYPHLGQWASFTGGLLIVSANFLWVGMMIYYVRKEKVISSPVVGVDLAFTQDETFFTHAGCGGQIEEDWSKTYEYDGNDNGKPEKFPAFRCSRCSKEIVGDAQISSAA